MNFCGPRTSSKKKETSPTDAGCETWFVFQIDHTALRLLKNDCKCCEVFDSQMEANVRRLNGRKLPKYCNNRMIFPILYLKRCDRIYIYVYV